MNITDSHCHLDDSQFASDRRAVIERARQAGIQRIMAIGTGDGPPDLEAGIRLAEEYPFVYATVGVHPHHATRATSETFDRLARLLMHRKVIALGEIGLDYHYDLSPREVQRVVFERQLELARAAGKPVVIHTREAWEDTIAVLARRPTTAGGIFHCFTGNVQQAEHALELGFHLSFGGIITFPKADEIREAASRAPLDRILVETDAPYLAPVPYRGKRNEPAFIAETIRKLAEIRTMSPEELSARTSANFERLCLRVTTTSG